MSPDLYGKLSLAFASILLIITLANFILSILGLREAFLSGIAYGLSLLLLILSIVFGVLGISQIIETREPKSSKPLISSLKGLIAIIGLLVIVIFVLMGPFSQRLPPILSFILPMLMSALIITLPFLLLSVGIRTIVLIRKNNIPFSEVKYALLGTAIGLIVVIWSIVVSIIFQVSRIIK